MPLTTDPEILPSEPELAAAENASARWERFVFSVCGFCVLGVVARELAAHAMAIYRHVGLPFQVDYEEGNILNALVRITHGLTPYPDPHAIPNILNPYGPVAYYLLAAPVKLFGVSFLWPRLMIAGCVAAISVFIALTIARQTGSKLSGIIFGAMYATLPLVETWSAVLRVDFLALAFATAGVWVFCRGLAAEDTEETPTFSLSMANDARRANAGPGNPPSTNFSVGSSVFSAANSSLIVSALLFVAALFVKYTYVAAPAACVVYLLGRREWKRAEAFVAMAAAMSAVLMLASIAATRGNIITDLFRTHADPFSLDVYLTRMTGVISMCRVLAVLAAAAMVNELLQHKLSVPALWLVLASGTAVTAGKLGSNWNHFLEWPAALCLCAGLGWAMIGRTRPAALGLVMATIVTVLLSLFVLRDREVLYDPYATVPQCAQAYQFVARHPGDHVLAENVGALVLAGKTVWMSNPFVYGQLVMRGGWKDAGLERMVRDREFDLIVAQWNYPGIPAFWSEGGERFSAGVVRAIVENYRLVQTYQCTDARYMFERK
ncbi:MAG: hypothetical protein ACXVZI_03515 [Terriglobales bacterium]